MYNDDFELLVDYEPVSDLVDEKKAKLISNMLEADGYYTEGKFDDFLRTIDKLNDNENNDENG